MKSYMKLVNFEFNRFAKIYGALLALVALVQIIGLIVTAKGYMHKAMHAIYDEGIQKSAFLSDNGPISIASFINSLWFGGTIAIGITAILFYIFMIWYRDWFGKNTFVYRLLMLPTARLNLFFAKVTTIVLATFGLIAVQLILFPVEGTILTWIVPKEFRLDVGIHDVLAQLYPLTVLFPSHFIGFLVHYGIGVMAVIVVFTAILLERCYRVKGIVMGIVYTALAFFLFISPLLVEGLGIKGDYFYPIEMFWLLVSTGIIVTGLSIWLSHVLLNKRIRV